MAHNAEAAAPAAADQPDGQGGLLGATAYAIQVPRAGRPGTEYDWQQAAKAWEDLQLLDR